MNKNEAWNKFKRTGNIKDYLVYAEKKRSEKNDNKN